MGRNSKIDGLREAEYSPGEFGAKDGLLCPDCTGFRSWNVGLAGAKDGLRCNEDVANPGNDLYCLAEDIEALSQSEVEIMSDGPGVELRSTIHGARGCSGDASRDDSLPNCDEFVDPSVEESRDDSRPKKAKSQELSVNLSEEDTENDLLEALIRRAIFFGVRSFSAT